MKNIYILIKFQLKAQERKIMNDFDCEYYVENNLNCKNDIDIFSICFIIPTFINTFIKNFMETFRHYFA